jgi:tungstate transport system substrate-binding protein
MKKVGILTAALAAALLSWALLFRKAEPAGGRTLRLATTTSVTDSGLLEVLAPAFEKQTGYHLEVQSTGSGKAIELLRAGAVDVAITHAPVQEEKALAERAITRRVPFMHNAFVLVGPKAQVSVVAGATSAAEALRRIDASGRPFISRGDGSGTNQMEVALWAAAGVTATASFIRSAHAGMGATLDRAAKEGAFTFSDRGTFLARRNTLDLVIVFQGDPALENRYSVLEPAPAASVNAKGAQALGSFLRSDAGRRVIGTYGIDRYGEALFSPAP